jgi:hypothetical protein
MVNGQLSTVIHHYSLFRAAGRVYARAYNFRQLGAFLHQRLQNLQGQQLASFDYFKPDSRLVQFFEHDPQLIYKIPGAPRASP